MTKLVLPPLLLILVILIFITISRHASVNYSASFVTPSPVPTENLGTLIQPIQNNSNTKTLKKEKPPIINQNIKASGVNVPILTYHYIGKNPNPNDKARNSLSVDPSQFDQELAWLSQNGYNTITLEDLYNNLISGGSLPPKAIILSFDDGYIDFYYNAYPILRKYNFKAVSFIPTGLIGGSYYMNWSMVEEISRLGGVEFESHGVYHKNLVGLSDQQLLAELAESKQILESHAGKSVDFIAYPYGGFNQRVTDLAQKAGYKAAASTISGEFQSKNNLFALERIRVPGMPSLPTFAARLRQAG